MDTVACRESTRGKRSDNQVAMDDLAGRWPAQVPGWLAGCLWLGVGHASTVRPHPSLGVVGEQGSHRKSCLQLAWAAVPVACRTT
jgi:hypothetical protein